MELGLVSAVIILLLSFYLIAKVVDDLFIKSLDNISEYFKLSPSVAGATFMAAGTSAPELSTTLFALFLVGAQPATGLGTVVGSAIFQILVVIGFAALVKTSYLDWKPVMRDSVFYAFTILLLIFVIQDGTITVWESGGMVSLYGVYLLVLFSWAKFFPDESKSKDENDPIEMVEDELDETRSTSALTKFKGVRKFFWYLEWLPNKLLGILPDVEKHKKWTVPVFLFSLAAIAFGSYWLVVAGEATALALGVAPSIVALTILAGGTSVPEMVSSAIVSRQGRGDMAISNAVGSNTFDILLSLGLPLFIYNLMNGPLENIDSANISSSVLLLFATVVTVIILLISQKFKAGRVFGGVLVFLYVLYVIAAYSGIL